MRNRSDGIIRAPATPRVWAPPTEFILNYDWWLLFTKLSWEGDTVSIYWECKGTPHGRIGYRKEVGKTSGTHQSGRRKASSPGFFVGLHIVKTPKTRCPLKHDLVGHSFWLGHRGMCDVASSCQHRSGIGNGRCSG